MFFRNLGRDGVAMATVAPRMEPGVDEALVNGYISPYNGST